MKYWVHRIAHYAITVLEGHLFSCQYITVYAIIFASYFHGFGQMR